MKLCLAYRCKREALGLTQAEFGKLVGVSSATISKFERGEELSPVVFNAIKNGVEEHIRMFDRERYIEVRILENALALQYLTTKEEKMLTLAHMNIHCSKLITDLLRED